MLRRTSVSAVAICVTMLAAPRAHADDEVAAPPAPQPTVRVYIFSAKPATLETTDSSRVCDSPCEVDVPVQGTYRIRISGGGEPSSRFQLHAKPGRSQVTLVVDSPPSVVSRVAGGTLVGVGVFGVSFGAIVFNRGQQSSTLGGGLGSVILGLPLMVGGLVGFIGGLALLLESSAPAVAQHANGGALPVRAAWRDRDVTEPTGAQPSVTAPLQFSF